MEITYYKRIPIDRVKAVFKCPKCGIEGISPLKLARNAMVCHHCEGGILLTWEDTLIVEVKAKQIGELPEITDYDDLEF
jgi:predicted RNA-binding Zn-ribbon protein involved in translation (DUF1610 family)